ncbi:hypothetical protein CO661_09095 [Sinorhizobium fredii]|uniref:Uncharacterized protein n=1 Tax=Rhizobium fredii TaxID=380 RepID=A0A2A6M268_RHIFR|nr:hypothetical protein [Sinorhizobium fredii]PDT48602.1 hypothetical protein CO661_09095 [Sinorhizobium fredii]
MKSTVFVGAMAAALLFAGAGLCADARSLTVVGTSLGMSTEQIVEKLSTDLELEPRMLEFPDRHVVHFGNSWECGWGQIDRNTAPCFGYRLLSLNLDGTGFKASGISLYQRFDAPIDVIDFKSKLIADYGTPVYANVSLDTYDYEYREPVFIWSDEVGSVSQETLGEMSNWIKDREVQGTEAAWLRIFLNSNGRQVFGMMVALSDQKALHIHAERSRDEWQKQQAEKSRAALDEVKLK